MRLINKTFFFSKPIKMNPLEKSTQKVITNDTRQKVIDDFKIGMTFQHMSDKYNCSKSTIWKICKNFKDNHTIEAKPRTKINKPRTQPNKSSGRKLNRLVKMFHMIEEKFCTKIQNVETVAQFVLDKGFSLKNNKMIL
jgi:hypothetical protein